ncbi:ABC transporter ATP-binding protein [Actinomyces trachealis]|uniref:ABC transporter ATP-binding protein n=1 Tax=Actinomyces trachealis TaxID=2763540 RepID=UPI0018929952|nr:ABC transporter ATP-binding protein [Actinomyces trachealis]
MTTTPAAGLNVPAQADHAIARLDRLGVRYAGTSTWMPAGVSLELPAGCATLLLGPSGCGKSTLTLTLGGLVPHSVPADYRGSVLVAGQEVADADVSHLARHVAMVMQDPDSQMVTTQVLDEVCYALENLRVPAAQVEPRAQATLQSVGMESFAGLSPWELSGGQRQRVALAAALAVEPALLVLDEPTANLDPAASASFYAILPELKEKGTTVLVVEHNLDDLIPHIDQVVALDSSGRSIAVGTPRAVFSQHSQALEAAGIRLPSAVSLHQHLLCRGLLSPAQPTAPAHRPRSAPQPGPSTAAPPPTPSAVGPASVPLTLVEAAQLLSDLEGPLVKAAAHPPATTVPAPGSGHDKTASSTTAPTPLLVVKDLVVWRGRRRRRHEVLHGVSLEAHRGEIVAVLGVNGSGKTTLLRALTGLDPWSGGEVLVAGRRRRPGKPGREVTLVTQNPEHQLLERTVRDELAHGMRMDGASGAQVDAKVSELLDRFNLAAHADLSPFLLSGGQQRRLTVASVLSEQRKLICLDEPTFGQDQRSQQELMGQLHDVAAQGTTVLLTTHDMELAAAHADRVLVLSEGTVLTLRAPAEALTDVELLERAGLRPPPLAQVADHARALGAEPGPLLSWKDLA